MVCLPTDRMQNAKRAETVGKPSEPRGRRHLWRHEYVSLETVCKYGPAMVFVCGLLGLLVVREGEGWSQSRVAANYVNLLLANEKLGQLKLTQSRIT